MSFKVVIPARYASSRLPAKPLLDIAGKPMVVHVVERALQSGADEVVVATDHHEILKVLNEYHYKAVMTRIDHSSGTDRIAEVAAMMGWGDDEIVVNVQGDEPLIQPELINEVAANLVQHQLASISTACHPIHNKTDMLNPNYVKVVFDAQGYALYFSRAPIPYARDAFIAGLEMPVEMSAYRHIGIYAYKTKFLKSYASLKSADIERYESLEQLRALWHGYKISVGVTPNAPATGVDTADDLEYVRNVFLAKN